MDSPVVVQKSGLGSILKSEGVSWGHGPLDVINAIGAVVVPSDDNAANKLFGALLLETLSALLVDGMPGINN